MVKGGEANKCENCGLKGKVFDLNLNKHFGFDDVPIDIFSTRIFRRKFGRISCQLGFSSTLDTYLGPVFGRQQRHKVVVVRGQPAVQLRSLAGPSPSPVDSSIGTNVARRRR